MSKTKKKVYAGDCETDPFQSGRIPRPFLWGLTDGKTFWHFNTTEEFVNFIRDRTIIVYMHNGGKFDFMYLLHYVKETKAQIINGRIVSMFLGKCELRDSYAAVPEALGNIRKDKIQYWKMEVEHRETYKTEILDYLRGDCTYLWNLITVYRGIAGTKATVASNALAFSRKLGIKTGKTNWRFDSQMRRYYYGGRTECFQPGTHKNIQILDIHSCYPYAMLHNHATGSDFHWKDDLKGMTDDEISRSFITLECTSNGAFPKRRKEKRDSDGALVAEGGLFFPHEYNVFHVTGWEYLVAKEFSLISNVKIQSVGYTHDTVNFTPYVTHWYNYKNAHSGKDANGDRISPYEYTTGKYMMNSLYGKMSQNPARYFDYKICQAGTPLDEENGWQLGPEFEGHEIHQRPSLWKYKYQLGVEWKAKAIYNNVATGASITGFARAHLLRAIHTVGVDHIIYCDTDSLFVRPGGNISSLPQTDALGDWELEEASAPIGHFAGKKLYGVALSKVCKAFDPNDMDPQRRCNTCHVNETHHGGHYKKKIASKGSKLFFDDLERIIHGETIRWESPAPSFSMRSGHIPRHSQTENQVDKDRLFVKRNIRATSAPTT